MKKVFLPLLLMPMLAFSQLGTGYIGVNTSTPQITLDINGVPNDTTKFDGVIAPRITGSQLFAKNYGVLQTGAIVYVTAIPTALTGQVINISEVGYYYFNGTVWKSFANNSVANDTLADVVSRGNYSPNFISFIGNTQTPLRDGALGMNENTYSMYFGDMNPAHTGFYNMSFGYNVFPSITTGAFNSAFGHASGSAVTTANFSALFGYQAGNRTTTGNANSFFGDESGRSNTTGHKNSFFGMGSGYHSTTGSYNSIFGYKAGQARTLGKFNVLIGNNAGSKTLPTAPLGDNNVFIGSGAGFGEGNLSNKLIIHSNNTLTSADSNSTANEGAYANISQSQYANALVTGDFQDRSFRINGTFQINPLLIKPTTTSYTRTLLYDPTTGDVGSGDSSEFLTRAGTGINRPLTGDLEYSGGSYGFYSQSTTRRTGFTTVDDDENPSPMIYNTNKTTGEEIKIEVQSGGIYLTGEILGDPLLPTPNAANSLVQKGWVTNLVNSTMTVPSPPATGTYILTSVNGVMQWVAN